MGPAAKRGVVELPQPQAVLEKRRLADCARIVSERGCRALPASRALLSVLRASLPTGKRPTRRSIPFGSRAFGHPTPNPAGDLR